VVSAACGRHPSALCPPTRARCGRTKPRRWRWQGHGGCWQPGSLGGAEIQTALRAPTSRRGCPDSVGPAVVKRPRCRVVTTMIDQHTTLMLTIRRVGGSVTPPVFRSCGLPRRSSLPPPATCALRTGSAPLPQTAPLAPPRRPGMVCVAPGSCRCGMRGGPPARRGRRCHAQDAGRRIGIGDRGKPHAPAFPASLRRCDRHPASSRARCYTARPCGMSPMMAPPPGDPVPSEGDATAEERRSAYRRVFVR